VGVFLRHASGGTSISPLTLFLGALPMAIIFSFLFWVGTESHVFSQWRPNAKREEKFIHDTLPQAHPDLFPPDGPSPAFFNNTSKAYRLLMQRNKRTPGLFPRQPWQGNSHFEVQDHFHRILHTAKGLAMLEVSVDLKAIFLIFVDTLSIPNSRELLIKYVLNANPELSQYKDDGPFLKQLELKYDASSPHNLAFQLTDSSEIIYAPQLNSTNNGNKFNRADEQGLPIFDNGGSRTLYSSEDNGLCRLYRYWGLDLVAGGRGLTVSVSGGRVIVCAEGTSPKN